MDFSEKGQLRKIDRHIGRRIRELRLSHEMTQKEFGDFLGVSFQQIQKYESGANRCPASRLYALTRLLDIPFYFFFLGL